jgi:hypothetical protein
MKPVHCGRCDNFDGQNRAVTHYISYTKNKLNRRILEDMRFSPLVKKKKIRVYGTRRFIPILTPRRKGAENETSYVIKIPS